MSPLFKDTLNIALHAQRLVVTRWRRGLAPRCVARHEQPVVGGEGALLAALQECLQDARWHDADARVMVSNAQVRYCIVPHSPHLRGVADESALALHKFQQVHGAQASAMVVRLSNPLAGIEDAKAASRIRTIRDFEAFLRDAGGFSHAAARAIASGGYKANPNPRDEGGMDDLLDLQRQAESLFSTT